MLIITTGRYQSEILKAIEHELKGFQEHGCVYVTLVKYTEDKNGLHIGLAQLHEVFNGWKNTELNSYHVRPFLLVQYTAVTPLSLLARKILDWTMIQPLPASSLPQP